MSRFVRSVATAFVVVLALAAPGPALADGANPPPTMEVLNGGSNEGPYSASISCQDATTGTGTFTMSGVALGPYPGTFTETATIEISGGVATSLTASFTVFSGATTIQGTKSGPINFRGSAICDDTGSIFGAGTTVFHAGPFDALYELTITSPLGTNHYEGPVQNDFVFTSGTVETASMQEVFLTPVVTPGPEQPATVVLTPFTSVNQVETSHTVTAQVSTASGAPSPGVRVIYTVSGSVSAGGSCMTDSTGRCTFSYPGPALPGTDAITACADSNGNGTVDPGEPCGAASKVWTLPASTPGQVTGGGYIADATLAGQVSFGFNAQSSGGTVKGNCNAIDHGTGQHVKCLGVTALVQTPTHATFFGQATVDGVATNYRIDVDDLGEPGAGRDTFKIQTDSGFAAAGVLMGGNIQIHS